MEHMYWRLKLHMNGQKNIDDATKLINNIIKIIILIQIEYILMDVQQEGIWH